MHMQKRPIKNRVIDKEQSNRGGKEAPPAQYQSLHTHTHTHSAARTTSGHYWPLHLCVLEIFFFGCKRSTIPPALHTACRCTWVCLMALGWGSMILYVLNIFSINEDIENIYHSINHLYHLYHLYYDVCFQYLHLY